MKQSAGILLFKREKKELLFFLVHPGGPFFAKKDAGWWTIPKGEINPEEDFLAAAIREFEEETGSILSGDFITLKPIVQKGGKKVFCWAVEGDVDPAKITSNTFVMIWPPKSGKVKTFPEIDKAGWFNLLEAKKMMMESQAGFLDELSEIVLAK